MARVLIGIVGSCPFVRGYVLGPELMARLHAGDWPADCAIREMNWGAVAIVQDLQASGETFDRVVLVGAGERGLPAGTVTSQSWVGQERDTLAVQRRVFEAVTGVVSMDNLLVIGAHFGVWPEDLFSVEVELADSCLGDLVMAEMLAGSGRGASAVIGDRPLTQADSALVDSIVAATRAVAIDGAAAASETLSMECLSGTRPVAAVCHFDFSVGVTGADHTAQEKFQ